MDKKCRKSRVFFWGGTPSKLFYALISSGISLMEKLQVQVIKPKRIHKNWKALGVQIVN